MKVKLLGVVALMALVVASCADGNPEAAGPSEGIQVHGDWTIDVYNEDGTLDERVEFGNALSTTGGSAISRVLSGEFSVSGLWSIYFGEESSAGVCPSEASGRCKIIQIESFLTPQADLRLVGSVAVEADGTIEYVDTRMGTCNASVAPADCGSWSQAATFTEKTLDPANFASVTAGQTVEVDVVISFTSG